MIRSSDVELSGRPKLRYRMMLPIYRKWKVPQSWSPIFTASGFLFGALFGRYSLQHSSGSGQGVLGRVSLLLVSSVSIAAGLFFFPLAFFVSIDQEGNLHYSNKWPRILMPRVNVEALPCIDDSTEDDEPLRPGDRHTSASDISPRKSPRGQHAAAVRVPSDPGPRELSPSSKIRRGQRVPSVTVPSGQHDVSGLVPPGPRGECAAAGIAPSIAGLAAAPSVVGLAAQHAVAGRVLSDPGPRGRHAAAERAPLVAELSAESELGSCASLEKSASSHGSYDASEETAALEEVPAGAASRSPSEHKLSKRKSTKAGDPAGAEFPVKPKVITALSRAASSLTRPDETMYEIPSLPTDSQRGTTSTGDEVSDIPSSSISDEPEVFSPAPGRTPSEVPTDRTADIWGKYAKFSQPEKRSGHLSPPPSSRSALARSRSSAAPPSSPIGFSEASSHSNLLQTEGLEARLLDVYITLSPEQRQKLESEVKSLELTPRRPAPLAKPESITEESSRSAPDNATACYSAPEHVRDLGSEMAPGVLEACHSDPGIKTEKESGKKLSTEPGPIPKKCLEVASGIAEAHHIATENVAEKRLEESSDGSSVPENLAKECPKQPSGLSVVHDPEIRRVIRAKRSVKAPGPYSVPVSKLEESFKVTSDIASAPKQTEKRSDLASMVRTASSPVPEGPGEVPVLTLAQTIKPQKTLSRQPQVQQVSPERVDSPKLLVASQKDREFESKVGQAQSEEVLDDPDVEQHTVPARLEEGFSESAPLEESRGESTCASPSLPFSDDGSEIAETKL